MKKKVLFIVLSVIIILFVTAAVTAAGAFCPVWLESYEEIYDMNFGLPFGYFTQTTDIVINAEYFPRYFAPQYFNENFTTTFEPLPFAASAAVNAAAVTILYFLIYILITQHRKKHPKHKKEKDGYIPVFND